MASSAHDHQQHFPTTISAPPPTPSTTQPTQDSAAADLLSRLLHRLPPSLSNTNTPLLLRRRSSLSTATTTVSPPSIPFTDLNTTTLSTISDLAFFQLTHHSIPPELARSAESDSVSLFNLSTHQKHQRFPTNFPLGFQDDDEDDVTISDSVFLNSSLLDSACSTTETFELSLSSLGEFTREMEKLGVAVVEALTCALGLQNPVADEPGAVSGLMWVSGGDKMGESGRFYPYVIGLHYQSRNQRCSLLTDTGLVSVSTQIGSVLITLGDIAQVWSNGKLKKVRGKPMLITEEDRSDTPSVSMSLLVTLPLESTVSPLPLRAGISIHGGKDDHEVQDQNEDGKDVEEDMFSSFSFEDYAWRVYHERVPLKDPLDRYRKRL